MNAFCLIFFFPFVDLKLFCFVWRKKNKKNNLNFVPKYMTEILKNLFERVFSPKLLVINVR